MPALPPEHVRGRLRMLGTRGLGLEQDARLGVLTLAVEQVELVGDVGGATFVLGEDQLEGGVGALEAAGGVDARGEPEAEGVLGHGTWLDAGDLHERPESRLRRAGESGEAIADETSVLALQ